MRVRWHTNAAVEISSSSGTTILCDPWVNPGAFLGSWFQWPPLPDGFGDYLLQAPFDAVYISHLHPDHFDRAFLASVIRQRPDVPIIIGRFAHPWLKRACEALAGGRATILEVDPGRTLTIGDIDIRILPADQCNPLVCGVSIPCSPESWSRGIDSVGIFTADGQTVVNANDALGVDLVPRLAPLIGPADLLMGHYGGASPFPQCFPNVVDKVSAARAVVENRATMLASAADGVSARYVMPFAGQYVLGGRLAHLNEARATVPLDEACEIVGAKTTAEAISVMPGGVFDLTSGSKDADYAEPAEHVLRDYVSSISSATYPYDGTTGRDLSDEELLGAVKVIIDRSPRAQLTQATSFVIGSPDQQVSIDLAQTHAAARLGDDPGYPDVTRIEMPQSLLTYLTRRAPGYTGFTTAHWNQADVGSHFVWQREGVFDLQAHMLLNFFGVQES